MMQMFQKGEYPGKSSIHFLPMIDLNPSDPSCIYSMLIFASNQARKYDVTLVITFDQPLWWKAMLIIQQEPANSYLKSMYYN